MARSTKKIDIKKIIDLREEGLTYRQISEKIGCSGQYAYDTIRNKREKEELERYRALDAAFRVKAEHELAVALAQSPEKNRGPGRPPKVAPDAAYFDEVQERLGIAEHDIKEAMIEMNKERTGVGGGHYEKTRFGASKTDKIKYEYGAPDPIETSGGTVVPDTTPSVFTSRLETMHMLPPGGGTAITYPWQNYAGVFRAGTDFYLPADQAVQQSRENARAMWNNLIIREALQSRLWSAAEQEWHIEPQDKNDPYQLNLAKQIQETIENIPNFLKLRYSLLKSRFFGVYGVQLVYQWGKDKKLRVKDYTELHGDSLVFKMSTSEVGIYVSSTGYKDAKDVSTEAGYIGRAHVYEDGTILKFDDQSRPYYPIGTNERDAIIIMRYDPQASDFLDSRNAGGVVGLGLRSTIYPSWYNMSEIIGNMVDWIERVGTGITMYKFLRGNEASYMAAVSLAESQSNQAAVMVPVDMETGGKVLEGVERIEPSAVGLDNMLKVVQEFFAAQIRRFIVGQDSTSQPVQAGLGSKIASVQESTFGRIVTFDCVDLQETLTHQLVSVIQKWNHPGTEDMPCKFVIDYSKPNIEAQINAAKTLYEMGIELDADQIRNLAGFSKPLPGASLTKKSEPKPMMPGMGGPGQEVPPQLQGEEEQPEEEVVEEETK